MPEGIRGVVGEVLFSGEAWTLIPSKARPGWYNAVAPDGRKLSMQPDGTKDYRDSDADGAYEQCWPSGNTLKFEYDQGGKHWVHILAWGA